MHRLHQLKIYLEAEDYPSLMAWARGHEGRTAVALLGFLTDPKENLKWRAVMALGRLSQDLFAQDPERVRNLVRQLIWNLNDESGVSGWGMPEALGEILAGIPELRNEYKEILSSYLTEARCRLEHPELKKGVIWALGRLKTGGGSWSGKVVPLLLETLFDPDPSLKGIAVWALGESGEADVLGALKSLQREKAVITIFDGGRLKTKPLGEWAAEAVRKIERRKKMAENDWKCSNCGYTLKAEVPPETCPSCKQKCEFVNITCYIPECQTTGVDPRLK